MKYEYLSHGLRNVLKTRNITYKDIALKMEMSESGVKKMLTANDISYNKLTSILDLLELKLEDLTPLAIKPYKKLSEEQERFFIKNPKHFNFFIQLHHYKMKSENLMKANSKLSKAKMSKFLDDLEKIKIIRQLDGKMHSLLEDGFITSEYFNTRYRTNYGVVIEKLNDIESGQWKSWMFEGFGTFSLSHNSALELRNQLQSLFDEFSNRSEREKKFYESKDLVDIGTLLLNIPMKIQDVFPII